MKCLCVFEICLLRGTDQFAERQNFSSAVQFRDFSLLFYSGAIYVFFLLGRCFTCIFVTKLATKLRWCTKPNNREPSLKELCAAFFSEMKEHDQVEGHE